MRAIGFLVLFLGFALVLAAITIGVPFVGVYLMGFIGTSGREAGGELLLMSVLTLAVGGVGVVLMLAGRALGQRARARAAP